MSTLLALVDGSIYSRSVCEHAVWIARRTGYAVDLLHVLPHRRAEGNQGNLSGNIGLGGKSSLLRELTALDGEMAKLQQKRGRAILDDARQILSDAAVDEITTRLRFGDIVETVAHDEAGADMVLIGKRGEDADFASTHLGSNLERIVRACHKPVLVAARAFQPVNRAIVAFDGGASVAKAIAYMGDSPLFEGVACRLLCVGDPSAAARQELDSAAERLQGAGRDVTTEIRAGEPEQVIAEAVDTSGANLLVMGAYGHSRIRTLIIGSTTTTMMRLCKVPVML
ncbi:MAG: universal stress protein, partial [Pseudomonadota bacterium]